MSEKILLTLDKSMHQWLEEKRELLRLRTIQQVILMLIGVAIERQTEAEIYAEDKYR